MEKEYYIYRIQYENLIADLDRFSIDVINKPITKDEIKSKLRFMITRSYNMTKELIDEIEEKENE